MVCVVDVYRAAERRVWGIGSGLAVVLKGEGKWDGWSIWRSVWSSGVVGCGGQVSLYAKRALAEVV